MKHTGPLFLSVAVALAACSDEEPPKDPRLASFDRVLDELEHEMAIDHPVDFTGLRARGHDALSRPGADDATLYQALWDAMRATRKGHLSWSLAEGCGSPGRPARWGHSPAGVCLVPSGSNLLVARVDAVNALGTRPGERVVSVDGRADDALLEHALATPTCGILPTTESARTTYAAMAIVANLREGDDVELEAPDGTRRHVKVAANATSTMTCREESKAATVRVARDDVAIFRVPSFDASLREIDDGMAEAAKHRAVVIDVRGNAGGVETLGAWIASNLPGARETELGECEWRDKPARFRPPTPHVLEVDPPFAFASLPVAVLVDGHVTSAADWFARAVRLGTDAVLVGMPGSGMYTGILQTGDEALLDTRPPMHLVFSRERCRGMDGSAFETRGAEPDVRVEPTASDLAAGIDTQLERAIDVVLSPESDRAAILAKRR